MSVRTLNALTEAGVRTVGDLLTYSAVELRRLPLVGPRMLSEVTETLKRFNLSLRR